MTCSAASFLSPVCKSQTRCTTGTGASLGDDLLCPRRAIERGVSGGDAAAEGVSGGDNASGGGAAGADFVRILLRFSPLATALPSSSASLTSSPATLHYEHVRLQTRHLGVCLLWTLVSYMFQLSCFL